MSEQQSRTVPTPTPSVMRSAASMSLATLMSRILGMLRDMVMAAFFPRMVTDAYIVAFRLPNLFRRVFGEGSLSASFVPLYVDTQIHSKEEARAFANSVYSMLSVVTMVLSVLGIIFMKPIMSYLVGGESYMQVPGKFELTVYLAQITFAFLYLVTAYAFLMGIANSHKIFFFPALGPAAFNLVVIIFAFFPEFRMPGDQQAIGVVVGGVVQLLMAGYPLIRLGLWPRLTWDWSAGPIKKFFQVLLPSILGMSLGQLVAVFNVRFASHLPEGSHSYIYLADRLLEFPQSLLSVSLGVALLPTLSELWARGSKTEFRQLAENNIRLLVTLSLPAAVGLYVLAEPIVRVIYQHGAFAENDVAGTAGVLAIYSLLLIVSGLHRVTVPCFYAIKNTWLPAMNSAFCILVHYFVASWATETYGLTGLVAATLFTATLNLMLLLVSYKIIFGELGVMNFIKNILWVTPGSVLMGGLVWFVYRGALEILLPLGMGHKLPTLISLTLAIILGAICYIFVNMTLRHPETRELISIFRRRIYRRG